jgi:hypothetical protein
VLNFLTPALAARNPAAYTAHFKRLSGEAQAAWLAGLAAEVLGAHLRALGAQLTLGLILTLGEDAPTLAAVVGGKALAPVTGWERVRRAELEARTFAAQVGEPVVTGLLELELPALASSDALTALGWQVERVSLCLDAEHQQLEWSLAGTLAQGGTFWSARKAAPLAQAGPAQQLLEQAARRTGARLELTRPTGFAGS